MTVEAPPTSLYATLADYRRQVAEGYEPLLQDVYSHIAEINQRAQERLKELNALVEEAVAAGKEPTRHWLYQQKRYQSLVAQMEAELLQVGEILATGLEASRNRAIALGNTMVKDAYGLLADTPVGIERSFATFPMEAAQQLILMTQPGPVRNVLEKYSKDGAARAAQQLVDGISLGHHPGRIAKELRQSLGISAIRATTIARTETMRAFREAARLNMMANADILEGWVWESARTKNTCAVCWGMHGTLFQFSEKIPADRVSVTEAHARGLIPMYTHPNCRCVMAPRPKSYADILGDPSIPDKRPPITSGADAFGKLDPAAQRRILGPGRHQLYQNGMLLRDMLTARADKDWGIVRGLKPVGRIKPAETAFDVLARLKAKYPEKVMFHGIEHIDPRYALPMLKEFERLTSKYPWAVEELVAVNVVAAGSQWGGAASLRTLVLRAHGYRNPEDFAALGTRMQAAATEIGKPWVVGYGAADVIRHEFGHVLMAHLRRNPATARRLEPLVRAGRKAHISEYMWTDSVYYGDEFLGEAFSAAEGGDDRYGLLDAIKELMP